MKKQLISKSYERLKPGSPAFLRAFQKTGAQVHGIDETGVYSTANMGPTKYGDPIGQYLFMRQVTWEMEQQADFVKEEQLGLKIVREHGGKTVWPFSLPNNAPSLAKRAQDLLVQIHFYRSWIEKGNARNAGLHAAQVAKIALRILVEPLEPLIQDGGKHRQRMKEMQNKAWAEKTGNPREDQRVIKPRVLQDIAAHFKKDSTTQPKVIYPTVAKKHGISVRTLYRYLEEDRKKRSVIS